MADFLGHRNRVYILTALLLLGSLFAASRVSLDEKVTAMLPDSLPMAGDFKFVMEHVPATETVYIDIEATDEKTPGKNPIRLSAAADAFYAEIKNTPFFKDILYKFSYDALTNLMGLVHQNRAWLLNENDLAELEKRMRPESIQARITDIKRRLLDPTGMIGADTLIQDPLGMDAMVLSRLEAFKHEAHGMEISGANIVSKDKNHLLIMATPSFPAVDTRQSIEMMRLLNTAKEKVTAEFNHTIRIGFTGAHVATLDNSRTIQQDVKRTMAALSAGIVLVGLLFFRRKIHGALIFLPTLVSLSVASAIMSLVYDHVSGIALGCGAILMGITVDYGIHVLFSVDDGRLGSARQVARKLKWPVFAGAVTSMAAFSCLMLSSLSAQRQMGLFAILGVGGAAVFAVYLLPYFIPVRPAARAPFLNLVGACDRVMKARQTHLKSIATLGLMLLVIAGAGIRYFEFEGDVAALNHLQPQAREDMDRFLETWGGNSPTLVLVKGNTLDEALAQNDALYAFLRDMKKQGFIQSAASLSVILPAAGTRKENHERFMQLMSSQRIETLKQDLKAAAIKAGFKPDAFEPFIQSIIRSNKTHSENFSLAAFDGTILEKLVAAKVIFFKDQVVLMTTLDPSDTAPVPEIVNQIKSRFPESMVVDKRYFIDAVARLVEKEFKQLFIFAALSMVLVVTLFFKNFKLTAIIISPVFLAAFATAGILGLFHIPVNLISMIFIIFVFGVGVDFSIFLASHELEKKPEEANVTAGAVIVCAMTTIGGFLCLVLARHEALFSIGVAGLTGMVSSLILSLILIPALLQQFDADQTTSPKENAAHD